MWSYVIGDVRPYHTALRHVILEKNGKNFVCEIREMIKKIKTDVDKIFLVLMMKKIYLSTSVFIFSTNSLMLKTKFYLF